MQYIKDNITRYRIELHGREHIYYSELSHQELLDDLFWAKRRIETEFQTKITTWYVPFGRKGRNPHAEDVCKLLGLKLYIPDGKVDAKLWFSNKSMLHVNAHFWRADQINHVNNILKEIYEQKV